VKLPYEPRRCFQCPSMAIYKRKLASWRRTCLALCPRAHGPVTDGCARMRTTMGRCAAQTSEGATMPVSVWTSTLKRTIQTAEHLPFPKLRWKVRLGFGCPTPTLDVLPSGCSELLAGVIVAKSEYAYQLCLDQKANVQDA